jgi:hypothetical protein
MKPLPNTEGDTMEELRREPRLRSLLAGTITFNNRQSSLSCTVRNVSPNGAMIVFAGIANAPEKFDLSIPRHNETRQATVMWRRHDAAGLAFAPSEKVVAAIAPSPHKVWLQGSRRAPKREIVVGY